LDKEAARLEGVDLDDDFELNSEGLKDAFVGPDPLPSGACLPSRD
jgi:hypothetical protein